MTITFRIHYQTVWGQQLAVTGPAPELGAGHPAQAFRLEHLGGGYWSGALELANPAQALEYKYLLLDENAAAPTPEWGDYRRLDLAALPPTPLVLRDSWRIRRHPENALYTSAFREVILKGPRFADAEPVFDDHRTVLRFRIHAPRMESGYRLCVTGNIRELGEWDPSRPLLLNNAHFPLWEKSIALTSGLAVEYKYGYYDPATGRVAGLETGPNRIVPVGLLEGAGKTVVVTDEYFNNPKGLWKGAGVAVPVFSLRSDQGLGTGEFLDLKLMVDWAQLTGLKMVQILPVNDTSATHTWVDSYPYAAISVFALHPLYLNIDALGALTAKKGQKTLRETREQLNALPEIHYEAVMATKLRFARQLFNEQKTAFLKDAGFKGFLKGNEHWLKPYAAFCYLRDKYGTCDFNQWEEWAGFTPGKLKKLTSPQAAHYDDIAFHYFLQYHLDKQLREAADYARSKGVTLKGDIPIGIYRYSVDAWIAPQLYNMDGQSGAPPDPFSETGQNWGFPTYNWDEMAKDGYLWWQQRLRQLSRYFDAFRIDHILGFFRIWEIPITQVEGLMGHFNPALPVEEWEFARRGIAFDPERYCRPFVTEKLLLQWFGDEAAYVRETFLETAGPQQYRFKKALDNQRAIEAFLALPENKDKAPLRGRLFDLVGNLLFFDLDEAGYHPRIMMEKTASFQALDPLTRERLQELYIDYFFRRQEDFWRQQAMTKLPAIKEATNMLICGEDLGMVPDCVPGVMAELGILSLEIQRMSKNPGTEFLQPEDIPYLSVCSPSTHDMSPLRAWWEEMEADQRERFYREELGFSGDPPFFCEPWVVERILLQHLYWPSMWTVFPLQELVAMDGRLRRENPFEERINIPAIPKHYWRYRFHIPMEDLLKEDGFNRRLQAMLLVTGRLG